MKKIVIVLLASIIGVNSFVGSDKVITQPYSPSLYQKVSVKYPETTALVAANVVGGICHTLPRFLEKSKSNSMLPALLGLAGFAGTYCYYSYFKTPNPVDEMLCNTPAAVKRHTTVSDSFHQKLQKKKVNDFPFAEGLRVYTDTAEEYEKKLSTFLLAECVSGCYLTREHDPKYRATYENEVVSALVDSVKSNEIEPTQFVSFASGGRFQDLVTLTKFLCQKPQADLAIHVIDFEYSPYVAFLDIKNKEKSRVIGDNEIGDLDSCIPNLVEHAKEHFGAKKIADDVIKNNLRQTCTVINLKNKQFVNFLRRTFPQAKLSFFMHESAQSYLDFVEKNKQQYADVLTTADIQDDMSLIKDAPFHYFTLCKGVLAQKPNTPNIFLATNMHTVKSHIMNISLQPKTGFEAIHYDPDKKDSDDEDDQPEKKTKNLPISHYERLSLIRPSGFFGRLFC